MKKNLTRILLISIMCALPGILWAQPYYYHYKPNTGYGNCRFDIYDYQPFENNEHVFRISGNGIAPTGNYMPDSAGIEKKSGTGAWATEAKCAYSYNAQALRVLTTIGSNKKIISSFDAQKRTLAEVPYFWNEATGEWTCGSMIDTLGYDAKGNQILFGLYTGLTARANLAENVKHEYFTSGIGRTDSVISIFRLGNQTVFGEKEKAIIYYGADGKPGRIMKYHNGSSILAGNDWRLSAVDSCHSWAHLDNDHFSFPYAKTDSVTTYFYYPDTQELKAVSAQKTTYAADGKATTINYSIRNGVYKPSERTIIQYDNYSNQIYYAKYTLSSTGQDSISQLKQTWYTTDAQGRPEHKYVTYNSSAGQADTSRLTYIYNSPTGTALQLAATQFQAYPNPFNTSLNISLPAGETSAHFTLTDLSGRILKQGMINAVNSRTQIDTQELKAGVYLLSVQQAGGLFSTFKAIKSN